MTRRHARIRHQARIEKQDGRQQEISGLLHGLAINVEKGVAQADIHICLGPGGEWWTVTVAARVAPSASPEATTTTAAPSMPAVAYAVTQQITPKP